MNCKEQIMKLRESVIFETAWLYETISDADSQKDKMIETVYVVWNRSIGRAGFVGDFNELCIAKEDITNATGLLNKVEALPHVACGNEEIHTETSEC